MENRQPHLYDMVDWVIVDNRDEQQAIARDEQRVHVRRCSTASIFEMMSVDRPEFADPDLRELANHFRGLLQDILILPGFLCLYNETMVSILFDDFPREELANRSSAVRKFCHRLSNNRGEVFVAVVEFAVQDLADKMDRLVIGKPKKLKVLTRLESRVEDLKRWSKTLLEFMDQIEESQYDKDDKKVLKVTLQAKMARLEVKSASIKKRTAKIDRATEKNVKIISKIGYIIAFLTWFFTGFASQRSKHWKDGVFWTTIAVWVIYIFFICRTFVIMK